MSFFSIDAEKCVKDGLCVMDCPMSILQMPDKNSAPVPVSGAEEMCIKCGHCVSICPTGAIAIQSITPENCYEIKPELVPSQEQMEHIIRYRRSIRVYKKEAVEKEKIDSILKAAAAGQTGHNSRSVHWLVIHDTEKVKELTGMVADWMRYMIKEQPDLSAQLHLDMVVAGYEMGIDPICRNAPHLVVAYAPKSAPTGAIDCATAMAYLELAAPSWGLGTCWAGFFNIAATFWPPLQKALELPKGCQIQASVMLGIPKLKYRRMPPRDDVQISWK